MPEITQFSLLSRQPTLATSHIEPFLCPSNGNFSKNGGTAPAGSTLAGQSDMLSVVLHEVGHALGLSGNNPLTQFEVGTDIDMATVLTQNRVAMNLTMTPPTHSSIATT